MKGLPYRKLLLLVVILSIYILITVLRKYTPGSRRPFVDESKLRSHPIPLRYHRLHIGSSHRAKQLNITILILAHFRTGSTLTGSILFSYPGAFYVYEPLQFIKDETLLFNGNYINVNKEGKFRLIQNALACNIQGFPLHILLRKYVVDSLVPIRNCLRSEFMTLASRKNASAIQLKASYFKYPKCRSMELCVNKHELAQMRKKCLWKTNIIQQCKNAPIRIFKYIKLTFNDTVHWMDKDPYLKLVSLQRDPRGYVTSHLAIDNNSDPRNVANDYCSWIRSVWRGKQSYLKKHPKQSIYTIQYEDLAMNSINATRDMCENLGIPFVSKVRTFVWNITMSDKGEKCEYCVNRGNGTKQALGWIHRINKDVYNLTNNICSDVIKKMGYESPAFIKLKEKFYNPYSTYRNIY